MILSEWKPIIITYVFIFLPALIFQYYNATRTLSQNTVNIFLLAYVIYAATIVLLLGKLK